MIAAGTLSRYFGRRFLSAVMAVFAGTLVLTALIDYLELLRRSADIKDVSALLIAQITLFRVPFITERVPVLSRRRSSATLLLRLSLMCRQ